MDNFWNQYLYTLAHVDFQTLWKWAWFIFLLDLPRYVILEALVLIYSRTRRILTRGKWEDARGKLFAEMPLVTVLVPGHNEGKHLAKLVKSLRGQTYQHFELIVVDDGSTDETPIIGKSLEKRGDIDLFLRGEQRGGKASAANMGLRYAKGKYIVHLDADSSLAPDALEKVLTPFYRYNKVGAVGGNLVVRNENDSLTTSMQFLEYIQAISVGRMVVSKIGLYKIVSGAFGAFPKQLLLRLGGWDIGPGLDGDITVKIRKLRYKVLFEENALCLTHVPVTWKALTKQRRRWSRSLVRFRLRKHKDVWFPDRNFSLLNLLAFFENVFFGFVLDFMWIFYTVKIAIVEPQFLWFWFPFKYTVYLLISLIQFIMALFVVNRPQDLLKKFIYIPLMPLYMGYYMRMVRTMAYVGEFFFFESYKDVWNPLKTSKKAREYGM